MTEFVRNKSLYIGFTGQHGSGKTVLSRHLNSLGLEALSPDTSRHFSGEQLVTGRQLLAWQAHAHEAGHFHTLLGAMMHYHEQERSAGRGAEIIERLNKFERSVVFVDSLRDERDIIEFRKLANACGTLIIGVEAPLDICKGQFMNQSNDDKHVSKPGVPEREVEWGVALWEYDRIERALELADVRISYQSTGEASRQKLYRDGEQAVGQFITEQCALLDLVLAEQPI